MDALNITISRPLIYFDNNVYNVFFDDSKKDECEQLVDTINTQEATLMVSLINIIELCGLREEQKDILCRNLDKIRVSPMETNPRKVVYCEYQLFNEGVSLESKYLPIKSAFLEKYWYDFNQQEEGGLYLPRKMRPLISTDVKESYFNELSGVIEEARETTKQFDREIIRSRVEGKRWPFTDELWQLCLDFNKFGNMARTITENDWCDMLHTVVPMMYCDFVVLERRMAKGFRNYVDSVIEKCSIAKVYALTEFSGFVADMQCSVVRP